LHHVHFSKINNAINNKRRQQQKRDDNRNVKKLFKRRRTSFSVKRAQNDRELVKENYKDVSGRDRDQYKSNKDNYRAEKQKSMSSQEDESMEKRKIGTNINDRVDCDRIENRISNNNDNDKKSEKGNFKLDMNGKTTREIEL